MNGIIQQLLERKSETNKREKYMHIRRKKMKSIRAVRESGTSIHRDRYGQQKQKKNNIDG